MIKPMPQTLILSHEANRLLAGNEGEMGKYGFEEFLEIKSLQL